LLYELHLVWLLEFLPRPCASSLNTQTAYLDDLKVLLNRLSYQQVLAGAGTTSRYSRQGTPHLNQHLAPRIPLPKAAILPAYPPGVALPGGGASRV